MNLCCAAVDLSVVYSNVTIINFVTAFSLKYQTAKNNSKWECPENFRELVIIEPKCPVQCEPESFIALVFSS